MLIMGSLVSKTAIQDATDRKSGSVDAEVSSSPTPVAPDDEEVKVKVFHAWEEPIDNYLAPVPLSGAEVEGWEHVDAGNSPEEDIDNSAQ